MKKFNSFVNESSLSDPVWITVANELVNNERVISFFNSLNSKYKNILIKYLDQDSIDLSKISKVIKKFNLIDRLKSKKGNINDKIEEVTSEIGETSEEFVISSAIIITTIIIAGIISLFIIIVGSLVLRKYNRLDILGILLVFVVLGFSLICSAGMIISPTKQTKEVITIKTIKLNEQKTIKVKIIQKGSKITFEEVK